MTALLIIFAKEPRPGQVKTRLCPPVSFEDASRLYHQFLLDTLEEMARIPQLRLAWACDPSPASPFFRRLGPAGVRLFPQEGVNLGERMARAFARGFGEGFNPVLLRGSDTPDLPGGIVREAQEVLAAGRADVVLGPSADGGYYLIGLNKPQPELFQGLPWSTPAVRAGTLDLARSRSLSAHLLPGWRDIDTYADLLAFLEKPHPRPRPGWRSEAAARKLLVRMGVSQPAGERPKP